MATITQAREFVEARIARADWALFGGFRCEPLAPEERHSVAAQVAPVLRGLVSAEQRQLVRFEETEDVLTFASSQDAPRLTQIGPACPDHLVHTKPWPLLVEWTPEQDVTALMEALRSGIAAYVTKYQGYLEANADQNLDPDAVTSIYREADAAADPHPRVILIPGVGMFTTGKDALMADVSAQLARRSIDVMHGAEAWGGFISLSASESYAVEYWPLEQYKLKQAPPEREFSRHVVLVTGAAGGIGSAICRRVAQDGAHIVATDIDLAGAEQLATYLNEHFGAGRAIAVKMDVTNEASVHAAFERAALVFGGVDVIVSNAGLASSASITETTLSEWNKNWNVLATGYFLVARESFRLLEAQGRGGNLVFVASKNTLVAGKNAAAYSTAKAAEAHLARCLAEEGGAVGRSRQYRQPRCRPGRVAHLGWYLATRAGSDLWGGTRSIGRGVPQTDDAGSQHPAGGHCRGGGVLRLADALYQEHR